MKSASTFFASALGLLTVGRLFAQPAPQFTNTQRLANQEVRFSLSITTNTSYRVEVSSNLLDWQPIVTWRGQGMNQHTDSAAPYFETRYYRAQQLTTTTDLTGDHLSTTNGDIVIHPLYHASFLMSWNGKVIYSDPDDDGQYASRYTGMPKADLILITHSHGDHYSVSQINAVRGSNAVVVVPQSVYDRSDFAALRSMSIPLAYGATTNVAGIGIQAVIGTNGNHTLGVNNCYVLTLADKRIFISGDTGNTADIRALSNIDVAFVCMNQPFTMTTSEATNCVRAFGPRIVYPYHYRNQDGSTANAATFKQQLGTNTGIEVRLRSWY
jgi:L-ascorbate metabolism protein UlaG (beta-lactamase superfamily)